MILAEVENAHNTLSGYGVDEAQLILHGSALTSRFRTTKDNPADPSDIDLLAIVTPLNLQTIDERRCSGAEIGRVRSGAGVVSLTMRIASISNMLNPTEVDIYTEQDLVSELAGDPQARRTKFVTSAIRQGILFYRGRLCDSTLSILGMF